MSRTDTIYALSSSPGKAAIAVVRMSGPGSLAIAASLMGPVPAFRRAALRTLRDHKTNTPIDQAMVLLFEGPASATGEDLVEFHLHGSRAVLDNLFGILALFPNTRLAEPGEFSRRAFENGKLDLTAAEGIADLIDAETEAQRRQALRQTNGALARLYDGWRRRLIEAQALIEAAIDFSDEGDVSGDAIRLGLNVAEQLRTEIATHLAGAARGEIIRSGYRVVIAGPPNAGKSSLLNALARRDVAIVSHEAGTTRDVIEVHLDLDGLAVIVSDTAGVREAKSDVEREGIRRAMDRAETADLVIWLDSFDDQFAPPAELTSGTGRVIHCTNKADLGSASSKSHTTAFTRDDQHDSFHISVKTGEGVDTLITQVIAAVQYSIGTTDDVVPTSARHREHLSGAASHLDAALGGSPNAPELIAEDMRIAATMMGRLTGRIDVEDVLDQIFLRFCIGK